MRESTPEQAVGSVQGNHNAYVVGDNNCVRIGGAAEVDRRQWRELSDLASPELVSLRQLEYESWKVAERRASYHWSLWALPVLTFGGLGLLAAMPLHAPLLGLTLAVGITAIFVAKTLHLRHEAIAKAQMHHHASRIAAIDEVLRYRVD